MSRELNSLAKTKKKIEYGDFQTPVDLAKEVVATLNLKRNYDAVIDPTCGLGNFLRACLELNIEKSKVQGWEINPLYVEQANEELQEYTDSQQTYVREQDFFSIDWTEFQKTHRKPVLFLGNPPWVTNSELGRLLSNNLPRKKIYTAFPV